MSLIQRETDWYYIKRQKHISESQNFMNIDPTALYLLNTPLQKNYNHNLPHPVNNWIRLHRYLSKAASLKSLQLHRTTRICSLCLPPLKTICQYTRLYYETGQLSAINHPTSQMQSNMQEDWMLWYHHIFQSYLNVSHWSLYLTLFYLQPYIQDLKTRTFHNLVNTLFRENLQTWASLYLMTNFKITVAIN